MSDRPLAQADRAEIREALSMGLRYARGGKRTQDRAEIAATAAAEHLIEMLELAGFVIMRKAALPAHRGTDPAHSHLSQK